MPSRPRLLLFAVCLIASSARCTVEYCANSLSGQQACEGRNIPGDSERSRASCDKLPGCTWGEGCGLLACESRHDGASCTQVSYCDWSYSDARCDFSGRCREDLDVCDERGGVVFNACSAFESAQCAITSGCEPSVRCIGTPQPCADVDSKSSCEAHPNCRWESHGAPRVH